MSKWILYCILPLLFVAAVSIGSGEKKSQGRDENTISIGLIAMLTGDSSTDGVEMTNAAKLAVQAVNQRGGVKISKNRRKVMLFIVDDRNNPDSAMNAARKLIYQDNVTAIVGPQLSRNAIPVARLAEHEKVVMVCPMSTNPETTRGKQFVFRIPFVDTFQGRVVARFARASLHAAKAAVLYDVSNIYNKTLAEMFRDVFEADGGEVVAFETYTTDQNQDYKKQLNRIAQRSPDVLFLPNYAADVLIQARQARTAGIDAVFLGGDGWNDELFAQEESFNDSFTVRHWHPSIANETAHDFVSRFQEAYNRVPNDVAATTYDAFGLIFAAIEQAGRAEPEAIQKGLYSLKEYNGVTGVIRYSSSGDPVKSAVIISIKDNKASFYTLVEP